MMHCHGIGAHRWAEDGSEIVSVCAWRGCADGLGVHESRRTRSGGFGHVSSDSSFRTCNGVAMRAREAAPDPPQVLMQSFRDAINQVGGGGRLVIGGKSLGGRIASMVADEAGVLGLVCLGYPFHPPGRPEKTRTKHLESLQTRTLILQGTRDSFGSPDDVGRYELSPSIRIEWLEDGDHSFKPRARSGRSEADNIRAAIDLLARFIASL
jgi:predicted alpha/beta-hydrolase family hydrolase